MNPKPDANARAEAIRWCGSCRDTFPRRRRLGAWGPRLEATLLLVNDDAADSDDDDPRATATVTSATLMLKHAEGICFNDSNPFPLILSTPPLLPPNIKTDSRGLGF